MSERMTVRLLCPACGSPRQDFAVMVVGHRQVWRCHHCDRTFRPPGNKELAEPNIRTRSAAASVYRRVCGLLRESRAC